MNTPKYRHEAKSPEAYPIFSVQLRGAPESFAGGVECDAGVAAGLPESWDIVEVMEGGGSPPGIGSRG